MRKITVLLSLLPVLTFAAQQPSELRLSVYTREGAQTLKTQVTNVQLKSGVPSLAEEKVAIDQAHTVRVNVQKALIKDQTSYSVRVAVQDVKSGRKLCSSTAFVDSLENFQRVQANCGDIAQGKSEDSIQITLDHPSMPQ